MGLDSELRHKHILQQLNSRGRIYVKEMARKLGVTEVTVRRDLAELQSAKLLKKTYGGAVIISPDVAPSVRFRQTKRLKAKKTAGKLASRLINDGDIIYLEAGSTCYEIIPYLADKEDLTILVNSLYLMRRLGELTGHKIIIIGGQYRHDRMDMVGPQAEAAIAQLGGFRAFTGADDITIDAGISGADIVTVGLARQMLKSAGQVIFVGDHTKFNKPALYKIADIGRLNYIVTDKKPSKAWHKAAKEKNIKLIYPK